MGVVEGVTEFLPVSSTGHLVLVSRLFNITQSYFLSSFQIAIQFGAILAVVLLYGKSLVLNDKILKRVLAAFIPTAVVGVILYPLIKNFLMLSELVVVWSLLIGGIILIIFESLYREKETPTDGVDSISYKQAILIGLFQSFAMVPGVSRSAATIIGEIGRAHV